MAVVSNGINPDGKDHTTWPVEQLLWYWQDKARLLANLRSCFSSLKVLEVDLLLVPQEGPINQVTAPYAAAAARAALQQELPGVYVLVRGHVERQDWEWWYRMPMVNEYDWEAQVGW
jgi:hypothetical protein